MVFLTVDTYSHAFLDVSGREFVTQFDYKLRDLFEMNDVFVLSAVSDDLVAPRDLEGLFGCAFGVFCEIPLCGERKSGVELFDAVN